jgi:hypothetical protein
MSEETDFSKPFRAMATRIDMNAKEGFSGAFVIRPPGDQPEVALLLLHNKEDAAMFWSLVKTKAEIALQELASAEQQNQWHGRR